MQTVKLVDESGNVVATAEVAADGGHYGGTADPRDTPAPLRVLFEEFEKIVNGQMFAFLDDIQERIGSLSVTAIFDGGREVHVKDLQVFPSTGDVSFKLAEAVATESPRVNHAHDGYKLGRPG